MCESDSPFRDSLVCESDSPFRDSLVCWSDSPFGDSLACESGMVGTGSVASTHLQILKCKF